MERDVVPEMISINDTERNAICLPIETAEWPVEYAGYLMRFAQVCLLDIAETPINSETHGPDWMKDSHAQWHRTTFIRPLIDKLEIVVETVKQK